MLRDGTPGTEQTKAKRDKKEKGKKRGKVAGKDLTKHQTIIRETFKLSGDSEHGKVWKKKEKKKGKKWENFLKTRLESEGSGRRWTLIIGVSKK